jgi:hypothetical protein
LFCVGVGGGGKHHVVEAVDDVVQDQAICSLGAAPMLCHLAKVPSFEPWLLVSFPAHKFYKYRASPTSIHYCYQRQRSCIRRATLAEGWIRGGGDACREGMEER